MVDITSLKVRLARLRLGSEFEDKHPELADPVTIERKKKKKQKKASKDPYNEYTKNTGGKRKKVNKLTRSDQKRGKKAAKKKVNQYATEQAERDKKGDFSFNEKFEEMYNEERGYVKDPTTGKYKKNKLTRSDQKRGKTERKKKKFKKTDIDIASGLARTESEGGFGKKTPSWENVPE